ncbi:hypothetical protein MKW94_029435 [Papaver nudicaule]|uniref:Protein MAK16 homolog n=1 Tax=Papaver nudicaule TaxID=74823 RepID=A0AA41VL12_PAPNU|nr:hypothetical protein [Papaver nudicaule]
MQHDEVIWQTIRHQSNCSYMVTTETRDFCRNPYNLTGICNRSSCPLANSRYATIREDEERAHMPNKLWERVKLPKNCIKALEIVDKHLMYWPKFLVHKTKQRLVKLTQMRMRMRKLALKTREKIITMPRKLEKRDHRREKKAETAALIEKQIEKELLVRLKSRVYDYPTRDIQKDILKEIEKEIHKECEDEMESETEYETEYVESYDESEEEDDIEDYGIKLYSKCQLTMTGCMDEEMVNRNRVGTTSGLQVKINEPNVKLRKKPGVTVEIDYEDYGERVHVT